MDAVRGKTHWGQNQNLPKKNNFFSCLTRFSTNIALQIHNNSDSKKYSSSKKKKIKKCPQENLLS